MWRAAGAGGVWCVPLLQSKSLGMAVLDAGVLGGRGFVAEQGRLCNGSNFRSIGRCNRLCKTYYFSGAGLLV
ncbi:hypothetical protein D9M69_677750 [compost metagenome]